MNYRVICAVLVACAAAAAHPQALRLAPFAAATDAGLDSSWSAWRAEADGCGFVYRLHLPARPGQAKLIVFLDGSGSNGSDGSRQMHYPRFNALFSGPDAVDAIVIAPQCPRDGSWDSAEWLGPEPPRATARPAPLLAALVAVVRLYRERYGIPADRCLAWGFSQGAFGVLDAVVHFAPDFGVFAALAGGGDPDRIAAAIGGRRLWLYHGDHDGNVPPEHSRRVARALAAAGKDCRLRIVDADHALMDSVLDDPEFRRMLSDL